MQITDDCMGCGGCLEVCPVEAIAIKSSHGYAQCFIDKRVCINCKACIETFECPAAAIKEDDAIKL